MKQSSFFIIYIFSFLPFISCTFTEEGHDKSLMSEEYNGIVHDTIENKQGAGYTLNNGKTFGWRKWKFPSYYKYISFGDTCYKPKGSTVLKVLRTNGDTVLLDLSWAAARNYGSFEIHTKNGKIARFTIDQIPLQQ